MLIWTGWGILVVPIAAALSFLGVGFAQLVNLNAEAGVFIGLPLACVAVWYVGNHLNRPVEGYHPRTGERVIYRNQHTLFWIPMQYFAFIGAAFGIVAMIATLKY
jgi:hypothetical protein